MIRSIQTQEMNARVPGGGSKPKRIAKGKDDGTFKGLGNVKGARVRSRQ